MTLTDMALGAALLASLALAATVWLDQPPPGPCREYVEVIQFGDRNGGGATAIPHVCPKKERAAK